MNHTAHHMNANQYLNRRILAASAAAVIFALSVLLWTTTASAQSASAQQLSISEQQRNNLGLRFSTPEVADLAYSAYYPARVTVPNSQLVILSAPVAGIVREMLASTGESATHGQKIAVIASSDLLQLQQQWLTADAELQLAQRALTRDRQLLDEGIIPRQRLETSERDYSAASAASERALSALRIAGMPPQQIQQLQNKRELMETLDLPAPLSGTIQMQHVQTGSIVSHGAPIYTMIASDALLLEIHTAGSNCQEFAPGQLVNLEDSEAIATLIEISCVVHEQDQGVLLRARIDDSKGLLRPGQMVRASIPKAAQDDTWSVPRSAVVHAQNAAYVFIDRDTYIEVVAVSIVHEAPDRLHIAGALEANSRLVVAGTAALKGLWAGIGAE
jgi:membrane fusion protein, heavy metal efflux system